MDSRLRFLLIAAGVGLLLYFFVLRKPDGTRTPTTVPPTPPAAEDRGGHEQWLRIRTNSLEAWVSTYSGTLRNVRATSPQFRGQLISTTQEEDARPLRSHIVFEREGRNVLGPYQTFQPARVTPTEIELVARPEGTDLEIRRTIRAATDYSFDVTTRVVNHGAAGRLRYAQGVYHWVLRNEESGGFFRQSWKLSEGLCYHHDDRLYREPREEISKRGTNDGVATQARWVGVGNLYFLSALVARGGNPACHLRSEDRPNADNPLGSVMYARLSWRPVELGPGAAQEYATRAYFGPKLSPQLRAADPTLREAVNLGFFAIIARGLLKLLQLLYGAVHNWGLAIILLTVIVRIALYPILARSTKSMAMMQKLKPELDALNAKYKDDQNQRGLATMELYRKHKINPLAGCLPQLAQLPVWWALYTTLQTSVELFHAPFGPWKDLSAADPSFVLPLVLGGVMFLQQKLMPPAMPDPTQAKIMLYMMPLFLTGISLFLPAGLALYMLVNSVLGIVQQRITKAQIDRMTGASGGAIEVRPAGDAQDKPSDVLPPGGGKGGGGEGGGRRGKRR